MDIIKAKRTKSGNYRVYGQFGVYGQVGTPSRVWIGTPLNEGPLYADSIIKLRDARGYTIEVFAGEAGLQFD